MVGGVDLASLKVLVQAHGIAKVNAELATVQGQMAATGGSAGKMGTNLKRGMMVGGTAIAAIGAGMAKLGGQFDDAYDTIRVGTGATGKALDGLKKDFRGVVKGVPTDFASASEAVTELNQRLGLTGRPLQERSKQFLELSRITKTDVSANIKSATRAFGDWNVKTGDQAATLDRFFRASQASGASVGELADQVVQFGAPLRQVGFNLDEATAMFASFEKAGVNTQTMMPGLKQALKTFMKEGIDPKQGLMKTFAGIKDGSVTATEALKIFGTRAGPDMVEAVRQGRFELGAMTKTLVNGKDTIRKAGKDTMDFSEKWQMFKNNVLVRLEPIATRVFDAIGTAMDAISKIDLGSVVAWFKGIGKEGSSLGIVLDGLGKIFGTAFDYFASVAARVGPGLVQIFNGVKKTLSGVIDVIAGIFTLDFERLWEGVKKIFSGGLEAVWGILRASTAHFREIASRIGGALIEGIKDMPGLLADAGGWLLRKIVSGITALPGVVAGAAGWLKDRLVELVKKVPGAFADLGAWMLDRTVRGFKRIGEGLATIGSWLLKQVVDLVKATPGALLNLGEWVLGRFVAGFKTITEGLGNIGQWLLGRIGHFIKSIPDLFKDIGVWVVEKVVNGFTTVTDLMKGIPAWLGDKILGLVEKAPKAFKDIGGAVLDFIVSGIEAGFKGAVNLVLKFANEIIKVIDRIPGVDLKPIKLLATGGKASAAGIDTSAVPAFARGGIVNRPMALVGEEGRAHPEFVIPTNPAYRSRALGLFGQLASSLNVPGYAQGGVLANSTGGPLDAVKSVGKGALGLIGKGASWFIDQLPGTGDLPDWLGGMGKHVLSKAAGWIKDKIASIPKAIVGGGIGSGLGLIEKIAAKFGLTMTSGYRPGDPGYHGLDRARDFSNGSGPTPEMMSFARAMLGNASALKELIYTPLGAGVKNGQVVPNSVFSEVLANHFNHVHVAMAKGGILGGYAMGTNYVPQTGPYLLHQGEAVVPASQNRMSMFANSEEPGVPLVHIEHLHVKEEADIHRVAGQLAWMMTNG